MKIEERLIKFLNKSADLEDLDLLNQWIQDPDNNSVFNDFVKTYFAIELAMSEHDHEQIKARLLEEIRKEKNTFHIIKNKGFYRYAALFIFLIGLGYVVSKTFFNAPAAVVPGQSDVTLSWEDGGIEVVSGKRTATLVNKEGTVVGSQKGDTLFYDTDVAGTSGTINTLKVPFGRRFTVQLSDGTRVFLNAGSTLTYPTSFIGNEKRAVTLVGEAYFDVAHNPERPFTVASENLAVSVLGTQFNMANYPEEQDTEVVLVQGSVQLSDAEKSGVPVLLEPGFRGSHRKSDGNITLKKVNTRSYTSWMQGAIVFRNETFANIIKKLERHYNVEVFNSNKELARETFTATLETDNDTIEEVLEYFNKVHHIEYTIVNNTIIIN